MNQPLVSIVIPAYKPDFFKACLDSALGQTYANFEVIVSDDCPTSAIADIVNSYHDRRIKYVRNKPAYGPMFNYVESFKLAKGELIKFLNDDDLLDKACLVEMVPFLEDKRVTVVTSYRQLIDESGRKVLAKPYNSSLSGDVIYLEGRSLSAVILMHRLNLVGEPTSFLFRKQDVVGVTPHLMCFGGYGYEKSGLGDVGLILNLLSLGDCVYLGGKVLSYIRLSDQQWQNQGGVRSWSIQSWKEFRKVAIKRRILESFSLGWNIAYKTRLEQKAFQKKRFITANLFLHQIARFMLPSR